MLGTFSLGAVIIVIGSGIILYPLCKFLNVNPRTFLPSMMFDNSINLGLPLALFAFREEAMCTSLGSNYWSIYHCCSYVWWRSKTNKPFKKSCNSINAIWIFFNYYDLHLAQLFQIPLKMLAQGSIPLVLFSLGVRFSFIEFSIEK